jgi:hypothetical protein
LNSFFCRILHTDENLLVDNGNGSIPINGGDAGSDVEEEEGGGGGGAAEEEESHDIRGSDDDEQEDPKDYCKGGYHPVTIGSTFNQRYHVIRKLGWGITLNTIFFRLNFFLLFFSRSFFHCLVMLGS